MKKLLFYLCNALIAASFIVPSYLYYALNVQAVEATNHLLQYGRYVLVLWLIISLVLAYREAFKKEK